MQCHLSTCLLQSLQDVDMTALMCNALAMNQAKNRELQARVNRFLGRKEWGGINALAKQSTVTREVIRRVRDTGKCNADSAAKIEQAISELESAGPALEPQLGEPINLEPIDDPLELATATLLNLVRQLLSSRIPRPTQEAILEKQISVVYEDLLPIIRRPKK